MPSGQAGGLCPTVPCKRGIASAAAGSQVPTQIESPFVFVQPINIADGSAIPDKILFVIASEAWRSSRAASAMDGLLNWQRRAWIATLRSR